MAKKRKKEIHEDMLVSGVALSAGASAVGALPASAAQAGVLKGMGTMGSFYPTIGTLGGASLTMKQLKKLRRKK